MQLLLVTTKPKA